MLKEGLTIYEIKELLGHKYVSQTERYLAGFDRDRLDERMRGLF